MPREVITLQFGSFANYVGAHYWNFQDELLGLQEQAEGRGAASQIDSDVLFRAGETLGGQATYTPRLVLWDLSGALGGASAGGALYRDRCQPSGGEAGGAVVSTWASGREVHRAAPVARSRFAQELESEPAETWTAEEEGEEDWEAEAALAAAAAQLDSSSGGGASLSGSSSSGVGVRYFTDFLKAHLHPRSVHQLAGAWHGLTPFGGWGDGGEHGRSEEQREEAMERIRFFAEECDHLQGLQCMVDDLTGFGQLATNVLQEVRDEYGSSLPVMLYALRPGAAATAAAGGVAPAAAGDLAEQRRGRLNEGLSLALLAPLCNTFSPLSPPVPAPGVLPLLRWQAGNPYHASALCAAALDTATLPYRLAASGAGPDAAIGGTGMWDLCQLLTAEHRSPLAALSMSLPCPGLPADLQRAAQQADSRVQQQESGSGAAGAGSTRSSSGGGGGGGSGGGGAQPFTSQWLASFTSGIPAACSDAKLFAESVVLRGPRSAGATMQLGAAADALDASLAGEQRRCVRQRTLLAQPLPVPLPFPHIFARGVSQSGDAPPAGLMSRGQGGGSQDIASCAVLTRLGGSAAFAPTVAAAQRQFCLAAGSAQGQATLESWGHGREEVGGIQERLTRLARAYEEEDDI